MEVTARPALPGDLGRVEEICRSAVEEASARRGGQLLVARRRSAGALGELLASGLEDPARCVIVGVLEGQVVGIGLGHDERDPAGSAMGVVDAFYVEPEARGVGVGEAVMDSLIGWFEKKGCSGVDAAALPGDRSSKRLFESSRFKARLVVFHRELGA